MAYQKELTLTKEQAEEFYKKHEGKDFFDSLTTHMSRYIRIHARMLLTVGDYKYPCKVSC